MTADSSAFEIPAKICLHVDSYIAWKKQLTRFESIRSLKGLIAKMLSSLCYPSVVGLFDFLWEKNKGSSLKLYGGFLVTSLLQGNRTCRREIIAESS